MSIMRGLSSCSTKSMGGSFLVMLMLSAIVTVPAQGDGIRCHFGTVDAKPQRTILYERTESGREISIWTVRGGGGQVLDDKFSVPESQVSPFYAVRAMEDVPTKEVVTTIETFRGVPYTYWVDWKDQKLTYATFDPFEMKVWQNAPDLCIFEP
ncbi:hypothetical protein [Devosia sp. MC521]|uniref:hypothetical protein n=1 Tax=Devosia sp. MC521 TaxID=2759954 RepID=UPI0015F9A728|nr:hypothetical protein [Devosia sp. MC521]MBJ6987278.1 hypothetical protein [Devosia sp. MC521]QMW62886.1 hypothetical protein H4N61_00495 [Devosia sp. MC521]